MQNPGLLLHLREDWRAADFLAVDLTAVHVFHRLVSLVCRLELQICVPFVQMPVYAILRHVDVFDGAVDGEYFLDVFFVDVPRQAAHVDLGGARWGRGRPLAASR